VTPEQAERAQQQQRVNGGEGKAWRDLLILNRDGTPKPLLANAITALRHAPEWNGVLAFDHFGLAVQAVKPTPWSHTGRWSEQGDRLGCEWLQQRGIYISTRIAGEAVETVARERSVHPVRDYLSSLTWDQVPRIDVWLERYLGVRPDAANAGYVAAVGARWLISAVARIYKPGCKADHLLILEGDQGTLKSSAIAALVSPEWFADELGEMGSKDTALQLCGKWVIELPELDSLTRSEVSRAKAFLSRQADHFRPPYARRPDDFPRQCVFVGTCNRETYLQDETGGRRFWPVVYCQIDLDALRCDRDQLWAEALEQFRAGAIWWLDTPEEPRRRRGAVR